MSLNHSEGLVQKLLALADVQVNGARPWDITIHNKDFYPRVLRQGSLGLGESYMDGWWDCPDLDQFFYKVFTAGVDNSVARTWRALVLFLQSVLFNPQTKSRSPKVAERHYDLGNELFENMLDRRMVYSCACWDHAASLSEAQEAKLDFVCRMLGLAAGMKVLDIGCGWGSFAKFAAQNYGVEVVGITLSPEQLSLGRELCAGLPVQLYLEDYRSLKGTFDRVVSLGMFEHVGHKNYEVFFDAARHCLKDDGRLFLSTIGKNHSSANTDPWIERYIFPNSHPPSMSQIGTSVEGRFVVEDWQNWAPDYDRTLMAWSRNFESTWEKVKENYSERFHRMWRFYLLVSAASFRSCRLQDWQILLSPVGPAGNVVNPVHLHAA